MAVAELPVTWAGVVEAVFTDPAVRVALVVIVAFALLVGKAETYVDVTTLLEVFATGLMDVIVVVGSGVYAVPVPRRTVTVPLAADLEIWNGKLYWKMVSSFWVVLLSSSRVMRRP